MSWEYEPTHWDKQEMRESEYEKGIMAALEDIVGNPDEVLASRRLFGMNMDTVDVEKLRFFLAYMLVYKDMR